MRNDSVQDVTDNLPGVLSSRTNQKTPISYRVALVIFYLVSREHMPNSIEKNYSDKNEKGGSSPESVQRADPS